MSVSPEGPGSVAAGAKLFAVSDLHIGYQENREITASLQPESEGDWLIVAGDVAEKVEDVEWALRLLAGRFAKVVWVPGNHELWTHPSDPVTLRGVARYERLVELCRELGVVTPEDEFPVWTGEGGPLTIAPMFLLYDYSFRAPAPRRRKSRSRSRTTPAWSAPTSGSSSPTPTPPVRTGAAPALSTPADAWTPWPRTRRPC